MRGTARGLPHSRPGIQAEVWVHLSGPSVPGFRRPLIRHAAADLSRARAEVPLIGEARTLSPEYALDEMPHMLVV